MLDQIDLIDIYKTFHLKASNSKFSKPGFNSTWAMNFQMFKLDLEKVEEPEIKLPTSFWSSKKQRVPKKIYFCFVDYVKAFDYVDHNKLWKILKEMEIPDHLTCLLRNLYAGQKATVKTGHGTTYWFQIGKGVHQGWILSPCLFNICRVHHEKLWAGWSTSWNQDCRGEISITSDMQMTPPLWQKVKN